MQTTSYISPTLHTAAIAGLELAVNKALELDLSSKIKLSKLDGHVFHFHCNTPELSLYLLPTDDEIRICGFFEGEPDTTLRGSAGDFAALARASDPANALINGKLELHGDSNALITLQTIAKHIEIDWEAPLAKLFGDIAGHQIGKGIRHGINFGQQAMESLKHQLKDFLQEESELLAPNWQLDKFYNDVDQLRMRTDRLEARVNKLRSNKRQ